MRFQGLNVTNYASLVMMGDYGKSIKDLALARIPTIEECSKVTLTGIIAFFLNCSPKFKSLSLSKCIEIKDICSASAQLPVCKSLRSLAIKDCSGFTDTSLPMVGMFCPQLENINLSGLSAITDNGFLPLMKSSDSGLVDIDLNSCENLTVTNAAVSALVKAHDASLATSVSRDAARSLMQACSPS
ncbi:hypothetical protein ACJX0J_015426, partial [Zea mays]